MKNYETVFILNPALSEEQVQKAVDKYEKYLKSNGSKIIAKEIWGLKKLTLFKIRIVDFIILLNILPPLMLFHP